MLYYINHNNKDYLVNAIDLPDRKLSLTLYKMQDIIDEVEEINSTKPDQYKITLVEYLREFHKLKYVEDKYALSQIVTDYIEDINAMEQLKRDLLNVIKDK